MSFWKRIFTGGGIVETAVGAVGNYIDRRQEIALKKLDNKARIEEAKTNAMIHNMTARADADIDWERLSIENSGWRDNYMTIFITTIVGACFIPGLQPYVAVGFDTLTTQTPVWFQVSFLVVVGSAFGVRVFDNFRKLIKGKTA